MSFGEGNLRQTVAELDARNTELNIQLADMRQQRDGLARMARFMADRMETVNYPKYGPGTWGYIVRELRKLGVEVER